jgi:hypothetical protein
VRVNAVGPNVRLLAARIMLPLGARRREIERLFARAAAAFAVAVPPQRARGAAGRLKEFALFTSDCAEAAMSSSEDLGALDRRLFGAALALGSGYRLQLKVRGPGDAMAAARLIYRGLGIDFRGSADGTVAVHRCPFAEVYSPRVCALVSALDRGLLAGLTGGGVLEFTQRITEGADCCRAFLTEGKR